MRIAALYDIHANLPATEATLHACREAGASAIVIGGDIAAGPLPADTLDILMALGTWAIPIQGRFDRDLVAAYDLRMQGKKQELLAYSPLVQWASGRITGAHRDFLDKLPDHVVLSADELGDICFCHDVLAKGAAYVTSQTPEEELKELVSSLAQQIVVVGGAHVSFTRRVGDHTIVGPGSVGMPYEDEPGAYWALIGPEVELRHTAYDLRHAASRIAHSGMPNAHQFADKYVLASPGRTAALAPDPHGDLQ